MCTLRTLDEALDLVADAPDLLGTMSTGLCEQLLDHLAGLIRLNYGVARIKQRSLHVLATMCNSGQVSGAAAGSLLDLVSSALTASTSSAAACRHYAEDGVRLCKAMVSGCLPLPTDALARLADSAITLLASEDSAVVKSAIKLLKLVHCVEPSLMLVRMRAITEQIVQMSGMAGDDQLLDWQSTAAAAEAAAAPVPDTVYDVLCAFADLLLAEVPLSSPRRRVSDCRLWHVLQQGVCHGSSLVRKQCSFVLSTVLDQYAGGLLDDPPACGCNGGIGDLHCPAIGWTSKAAAASRERTVAAWQNYLLLLDSFSEKQYHVIEPALSRLQLILSAAEHGIIHASWLAVLFVRVSMHENAALRKWGLCQMLSLDVGRCNFFRHGQEKFLLEDVVRLVTSDINSFLRQHGEPRGVEPQVGVCFQQYLQSCDRALLTLDEKKSFFRKLIAVLACGAGSGWCPVPGMYVCKALQCIPGGSYWDRSTFQQLCHMLSVTIRQADTRVRFATQLFLLNAAINMTDKAALEIADVLQLIKALSADEILRPASGLPRRCFTRWLTELFTVWGREKCAAAIGYAMSGGHVELMLLLSAAGVVPLSGPSSFQAWLVDLVDTVNSSESRVYLSAAKLRSSTTCLATLLQWASDTGSHQDLVEEAVLACNFLPALLRPLDETPDDLVDGPLLRATWASTTLDTFCRVLGSRADKQICAFTNAISDRFLQMSDSCIRKDLQSWCLLATIADSCCVESVSSATVHMPSTEVAAVRLLMAVGLQDHLVLPDPSLIGGVEERGRIVDKHVGTRWSCRRLLLRVHPEMVDAAHWMEQARESLYVVSGDTNIAIFGVLTTLFLLVDSSAEVASLVTACFAKVEEESRSSSYPQQLAALLRATFQPQLMAKEQLESMHCEVAAQVLILGSERLGLANLASTILLGVFNSEPCLAEKYLPLLVDLAIYGPVYGKAAKTDLDVYMQLEQMEACRELCRLPGETSVGRSKAADEVRVAVICFFATCRMDGKKDAELGRQFVLLCMSRFIGTLNLKTFRNFPHSLLHRQRHRLLCIILSLHQFCLHDTATRSKLIDSACCALSAELQPSNRLQVEWLLVVLLHACDEDQRLSFALDLCDLAKMATRRPVFVCSMLSTMAHLCALSFQPPSDGASSRSKASAALVKAFVTATLPWAMCSKYHIRAYAQAALLKVWQHDDFGGSGDSRAGGASEPGSRPHGGGPEREGLHDNPLLQSVMKFVLDTGAIVEKSTRKLFEHFIWQLRPSQDLTLEAIFYLVPLLTGVSDDELVEPWAFMPWNERWSPPLWCKNENLKACQPITWQLASREAASADKDGDIDVTIHDIQKKIVTWRTQEPEDCADADASDSCRSDGMVLVASLLDRMPNVAGLCRTGEIFGVKEYIMSNLSTMDDAEFQAISVSAQRWIRTKQVAAHLLKLYLTDMRASGYSLVGMEQTANSVCLTDYIFQSKTVLLLGNEKTGIPADIIQELDVCLQIPQQGIIRSLNVHVCGAIAIWEYRRQMLLRSR